MCCCGLATSLDINARAAITYFKSGDGKIKKTRRLDPKEEGGYKVINPRFVWQMVL
jgi:hypothetical protein